MKICVAPASNLTARHHLKTTVEQSIDRDKLNLGESDLNLRLTKYFKAWGFDQRYKKNWEKMSEGDVICFYSNKEIIYKAEIVKKISSRKLSDQLWLASSDSQNWPLIVIISNVERVSIPISDINGALGYSQNFVFQKSEFYDGEKAEAFGGLLNTIFEESILFANNDDFPKNYELKAVVNNGSTPQPQSRNFSIDKMLAIKRIVNFEQAAKVNDKIGDAAERLVLIHLRKKFPNANVKLTKETNNTLPFDILIEENFCRTVVEVKGTQSDSIKTDFYMSATEFDFALYCFENNIPYKLFRVIDVAKSPKIIELDAQDLLKGEHITPDTYRIKMSQFDLKQ